MQSFIPMFFLLDSTFFNTKNYSRCLVSTLMTLIVHQFDFKTRSKIRFLTHFRTHELCYKVKMQASRNRCKLVVLWRRSRGRRSRGQSTNNFLIWLFNPGSLSSGIVYCAIFLLSLSAFDQLLSPSAAGWLSEKSWEVQNYNLFASKC